MLAARPGNFTIFLIVVLIITFSLYWKDGYDKIKDENKNISFFGYVKNDTLTRCRQSIEFIKFLPNIINEAIQSDDKIKRGSLNKLADGLELFRAENEKYPAKLAELNADYMNSKTKILEEKGLRYSASEDGQHFTLSIPLKGAEAYTIQR